MSTGKPKVGGAVYYGTLTATLPTDATTALGDGFTSVGFISSDGVTNSNSADTSTTNAWGGDLVMTTDGAKSDTFAFSMIQSDDPDVLTAVYGSSNVTLDETKKKITVKANSSSPEEHVWVIDMVLRNNAVKRIVIPDGKLTALDDITYNGSDPVGFPVTITALPDASGNTHYDYIQLA